MTSVKNESGKVHFLKVQLLYSFLALSFLSCKSHKNSDLKCPKADLTFVEEHMDFQINLDIAFDDIGDLNHCAEKMGKPILNIYGCYECVGNLEVILRPLANQEINSIIKEKFLVRYYYVDGKDEMLISSGGKDLEADQYSVQSGEFFRTQQKAKYGINSQPFYSITNYNEVDLAEPLGYLPVDSLEKFSAFLNEGLKNIQAHN